MRIESSSTRTIAHPPKRGLSPMKLIAPHTGPVPAPGSSEADKRAKDRRTRNAQTRVLMRHALARLRQAPKPTLYFTGGTAPER